MFRSSGLPSKLGERRRRRRLFLLASVPIALFLLLAVFVILSRLSAITIERVHVEGAVIVSSDDLTEAVERALEGNYALLFPKRNIFLYPKDETTLLLFSEFPRLKSARLSFEDFNTLLLTVEERQPHALWCGVKPPQFEELLGACSFSDVGGFVFAKAPEFTGEVYVRYFGALRGVTSAGAGQILSPEEFGKLDAFIGALRSIPLEVTSVSLEDNGDATAALAGGGRIFFSLVPDYAAAFENLTLSLSSDAFRGKSMSELDYLDLRFGNRVFFRFK